MAGRIFSFVRLQATYIDVSPKSYCYRSEYTLRQDTVARNIHLTSPCLHHDMFNNKVTTWSGVSAVMINPGNQARIYTPYHLGYYHLVIQNNAPKSETWSSTSQLQIPVKSLLMIGYGNQNFLLHAASHALSMKNPTSGLRTSCPSSVNRSKHRL